MKAILRLLPLVAVLSTAPGLAQGVSIERALADPARSAAARAQDAARKPADVLAFAGVRTGDSVADFMAGNGYFTELLGRLVGPKGTVYALNPPSFHDSKDWEKGGNARPNVRTLVAPVAQMQLAPASIDVLFAHHTYHDLYWESERFKFPRLDVPAVLADWFRAVKPGGHVVIVDHVGPAGDPRANADALHRIDPAQVKADMAAAGFVLVAESSVLQRSDDNHATSVFAPEMRGKTDRMALKFRRP